MQKIFLVIFLFPILLIGQSDSIYNDDPNQHIPVGMEKPKYKKRYPTGENFDHSRISPPNWWVGMNEPKLQIMIYDENIKGSEVGISAYKGVKLLRVIDVDNKNYLFLDIEIGKFAKPGTIEIIINKGSNQKIFKYDLFEKRKKTKEDIGVNSSDFIYLIMPDRFANGDYSNDSYDDMRQIGINRDKMYFRHGGDLQGIINHLDYIDELGVTALWLNPVLENDQPYESYHGYAVTDNYKIDKRFGSNEKYKEFVDSCHSKGIKVVMDVVFNHLGHENWLMRDIPEFDWIHQDWEEFTKPIYRATMHADPYATEYDKSRLLNGWFDNNMPDLNQSNPRLAMYLIQNSIWWIEYSGINTYRIDTYHFCDGDFMSDWGLRIKKEYPMFTFFGETWIQDKAIQAYFVENSGFKPGFNTNLQAITDFQLNFAIKETLNQDQSWTGGVSRLYYTLAQDFLYKDASKNVIFLGNHDMDRFYSSIGENFNKFKVGVTLLLTLRGTPSMYYGSELLFKGFSNPDGKVRADFPGGWNEDLVDKFEKEGRTAQEKLSFEYVKFMANYRKTHKVLQTGKFKHFVPEDGVYVYTRFNDNERVVVISNVDSEKVEIDLKRYFEIFGTQKQGKDIFTGKIVDFTEKMELAPWESKVFEIIK